MGGEEKQKLDVWRPSKPGSPFSPTFLSFYYVSEPKMSGESDSK